MNEDIEAILKDCEGRAPAEADVNALFEAFVHGHYLGPQESDEIGRELTAIIRTTIRYARGRCATDCIAFAEAAERSVNDPDLAPHLKPSRLAAAEAARGIRKYFLNLAVNGEDVWNQQAYGDGPGEH